MTNESRTTIVDDMNRTHNHQLVNDEQRRNWKLLIDPQLKKGLAKLYRFDGHCANASHGNSAFNITSVTDPRTHIPRFYARAEPCDLPIPPFRIDAEYVRMPPEREVSFFGLNDNINQQFLIEFCRKCGDVGESKIYYHPTTKKHLGIARVLFSRVRDAKLCIERYNNLSVMGEIIRCICDPFGREVKRRYEELTNGISMSDLNISDHQMISNQSTIAQSTPIELRNRSTQMIDSLRDIPAEQMNISTSAKWTSATPSTSNQWYQSSSILPNWPPPPPPLISHHSIEETPTDPTPSMLSSKSVDLKEINTNVKDKSNATSSRNRLDYYGNQIRASKSRGKRHHSRSSSTSSSSREVYKQQKKTKYIKDEEEDRRRTNSRERSYVEVVREEYYREKKPIDTTKNNDRYRRHNHNSTEIVHEIEKYKVTRRYKRRSRDRSVEFNRSQQHSTDDHLESVSSDSDNDSINKTNKVDNIRLSRNKSPKSKTNRSDSSSGQRHRWSSSSSSSSESSKFRRRNQTRKYAFERCKDNYRQKNDTSIIKSRDDINNRHLQSTSEKLENVSDSDSSTAPIPNRESHSVSTSTNTTFVPSSVDLESRIQSILAGGNATFLPPPPVDIASRIEPVMIKSHHSVLSDVNIRPNLSKSETISQPSNSITGVTPVQGWSPLSPVIAHQSPLFWQQSSINVTNNRLPHRIRSRFNPLQQQPSIIQRVPLVRPVLWSSIVAQKKLIDEQCLSSSTKQSDSIMKSICERTMLQLHMELRTVLYKDLMRRLIENTAYSTMDSWNESRNKPQPSFIGAKRPDIVDSIQSSTMQSMSDTLSKLFSKESNSSSFAVSGLTGLPGFGLKAAMPRLPSFKKRRQPQSRSSRSRSSSVDELILNRRTIDRSRETNDNEDDHIATTVEPAPEYLSSSSSSTSPAMSDVTSSSSTSKTNVDDNDVATPDNASSITGDDEVVIDEKRSDSSTPIDATTTEQPIDPMKWNETMYAGDSYAPTMYDHCYQGMIYDNNKYKYSPATTPTPTAIGLAPLSPHTHFVLKSTIDIKSTIDDEKSKDAIVKSKKSFPLRSFVDDIQLLNSFLTIGLDDEDVQMLRTTFDSLSKNTTDNLWSSYELCWLSPPTIPTDTMASDPFDDHTMQRHKSGCARTEGYYKLSYKQKRSLIRRSDQAFEKSELQSQQDVTAARHQALAGREARSVQRRILTTLGTEVAESDLLKFNQLKFRKKMIKFARSKIHGFGLYALETIAPDEMIIEYVGEKIRFNVADMREKRYERIGIGSSYLFRIDNDQVIDATKTGNFARFINHSCVPNCYAKIVTVDGDKRIVIYSKNIISVGDEITYDYKFPVEDDKIDCLCGAPTCRGSLN